MIDRRLLAALVLAACTRAHAREPRTPRLTELSCTTEGGGTGGPGGAYWNPTALVCTASIGPLRNVRAVAMELELEQGGRTTLVASEYVPAAQRDRVRIEVRLPIDRLEPLLGHENVIVDAGATGYRLAFHAAIDVAYQADEEIVRAERVDQRSTSIWIAFGE